MWGAIGAAGCRTRPYELGTVPDLTVIPPDLTVLPDLFVPPDFLPPPDLIPPFFCRPIYTVDVQDQRIYGFDPDTVTFTRVGNRPLSCPGAGATSPNTMSIDLSGNAWVLYSDGAIYTVDLLTGTCKATAFDRTNINPAKANGEIQIFGSSFSLDGPNTANETLYVSLGTDLRLLAIDPITLAATLGPAIPPQVELTGTPEGELWMFSPGRMSFIARLDKVTGFQDRRIEIPEITTAGGFAFAYWGGSFWVFNGDGAGGETNVYRVDKDTGVSKRINAGRTGRFIVGAGISGCAPGARDQ